LAARAHPDLVHAPVARAVHSLELAAGLIDTRELVRSAAQEAALPPARVAEVVLAAHEVAMNALTHGLGRGDVRIWAVADELVCEVEDRGPGISDSLAGSKPPATDRTRGRGLWITRQLCDHVEIESAPGRTLVRLHWRVY
jgi:anti-sigma regulatory factor (Ser/Thr protein kinase)